MKRQIGFALFFVAAGIVLDMLLPTLFVRIVIAILCVLFGYELYCCR